MNKLQKLLFAIGLRDDASSKLGKLQQAIGRTCRQIRNNFEGIKSGALTAVGSGMTLFQMLTPAVDFNRAVGEVASLDVAGDALKYLQAQSKQFVMQYGGNAADVVRASYDIQSAIAGLEGKELGTFTVASATLAKATKADAATITAYMGTMYGIFKTQADTMGKSAWVEQLTGRTALAVQMFKTTGAEMSAAFTSVGASATSAGIAAHEQMAVLGMLQATMGGSEAGTKYKSFLAGVGGAQQTLGLKFTDDGGNMLGMEAILDKLRGKFGDSLDVKESDLLKKAFGSDEAVAMIKLLINDTTSLSANINALGKVTGMDKARTMAAKMTDVWGRLSSSVNVLAITFSQKMLPSIEPVSQRLANFMGYLVECMEIAPDLTGKIGLIVAAAILLGGAMGILGLVVAVNKMAFLGLKTVCGPMVSLLKVLAGGFMKLAAAIWANPLVLLVGILIIVAVAIAGLILYWDEFKAAFGDTAWGQAIIGVVQTVCEWWDFLTTALSNVEWGKAMMQVLALVLSPLLSLGKALGWVGEKLGLISGETPGLVAAEAAASGLASGMPAGVNSAVPQGLVTTQAAATGMPPSVHTAVPQGVTPIINLTAPPGLVTTQAAATGMPPSVHTPGPPGLPPDFASGRTLRIAPDTLARLSAPTTLDLPQSFAAARMGMVNSNNAGRSTTIGTVNITTQTAMTREEFSELAASY